VSAVGYSDYAQSFHPTFCCHCRYSCGVCHAVGVARRKVAEIGMKHRLILSSSTGLSKHIFLISLPLVACVAR